MRPSLRSMRKTASAWWSETSRSPSGRNATPMGARSGAPEATSVRLPVSGSIRETRAFQSATATSPVSTVHSASSSGLAQSGSSASTSASWSWSPPSEHWLRKYVSTRDSAGCTRDTPATLLRPEVATDQPRRSSSPPVKTFSAGWKASSRQGWITTAPLEVAWSGAPTARLAPAERERRLP